jgi:hypothetical protein
VATWAAVARAQSDRVRRVAALALAAPEVNSRQTQSKEATVQGLASANTRTLNAMGYYDDFCVKFDGRWLIKEKRIYRCNDETPLPW